MDGRVCADGLARITREEGVVVLWRGAGANVARAMLMTAAQLATYDIFKGFLLRTPYATP
jgi:solute carrier family 25 (mitochondrial dicarboxylate transporter), member 10